jgi:hypothetical protein
MDYLYSLQLSYLNSETITCDLYNQIPGLFQNCTITEVTSFEDLIKAPDGNTYFSVRMKGSREINFIDL